MRQIRPRPLSLSLALSLLLLLLLHHHHHHRLRHCNRQHLPTMNSPSLVLATTAVAAVSSAVLFLAFSRHKLPFPDQEPQPPEQILRSCLFSVGKKKERKKKKKVRFAADVKEPRGNGDEFRMKMKKIRKSSPVERSCRSEIPANRIALYSGILRDRANRMACSH